MKPLHPRAVIDTNVLLDFWVFDDAAARPLRAAVESGQRQRPAQRRTASMN